MTKNCKRIVTFLFVSLIMVTMVGCNLTFEQNGDEVTENSLNITNTVIIKPIQSSSMIYFCIIDDQLAKCSYGKDNKLMRTFVRGVPEGLTNLRINKAEYGKYDSHKEKYLSFLATADGEEKQFLLSGRSGMFGLEYAITEIEVEDLEPSLIHFFGDGNHIYMNAQGQRELVIESAKLLRYQPMNTENSKFWLVYEQNGQQKLSTVNAECKLENTTEVDINILKSDVIRVRDESSTEYKYNCKYVYFASENQIILYDENNSLLETIQIDSKLYGLASEVTVDNFTLTIAVKKDTAFDIIYKTFDL